MNHSLLPHQVKEQNHNLISQRSDTDTIKSLKLIQANSSVDETYAINKLPVIIAKELDVEKKNPLSIKGAKFHKARSLSAWKLSDIQVSTRNFYHKIPYGGRLCTAESITSIESIPGLARYIVVPKKGRKLTVVVNEENELIPTLSWHVSKRCIVKQSFHDTMVSEKTMEVVMDDFSVLGKFFPKLLKPQPYSPFRPHASKDCPDCEDSQFCHSSEFSHSSSYHLGIRISSQS
ncbi:hypothetical protein Tco_1265834 [Tanacetum coccineum]